MVRCHDFFFGGALFCLFNCHFQKECGSVGNAAARNEGGINIPQPAATAPESIYAPDADASGAVFYCSFSISEVFANAKVKLQCSEVCATHK